MVGTSSFQFCRFETSPAGEPHVYVREEPFALAEQGEFNVEGTTVVDITYTGGGWAQLCTDIARPAGIPDRSHLQALYENLENLSAKRPLVLVIRGVDRLVTDLGAFILHAMAHWEAFVRHPGGFSPMYLVLVTRPVAPPVTL